MFRVHTVYSTTPAARTLRQPQLFASLASTQNLVDAFTEHRLCTALESLSKRPLDGLSRVVCQVFLCRQDGDIVGDVPVLWFRLVPVRKESTLALKIQ